MLAGIGACPLPSKWGSCFKVYCKMKVGFFWNEFRRETGALKAAAQKLHSPTTSEKSLVVRSELHNPRSEDLNKGRTR